MFDVTFSSGRPNADAPFAGAGFHDPAVAFDAADLPESWDDDALMAEPDGDVFGWDDEEEEDDDFEDDDTDLADDFDDDDE